MKTPRIPACLFTMLLSSSCATIPSQSAPRLVADRLDRRDDIRFDNEAQTYVDVYLVRAERQWRLGRVAAGAHTVLRIPTDALEGGPSFVRLTVLPAAHVSADAAHDPVAIFTIAQPMAELTSQRWAFTMVRPGSPQILGASTGSRP